MNLKLKNQIKKLWLKLSRIITFSSRKIIIFNLLSILAILRIVPPEKIGSLCVFKNFIFPLLFKSCPTKGLFIACECPACKLTRSTAYFLHGNIEKALELNKLVILTMVIILSLIIINLYKIIYKKTIIIKKSQSKNHISSVT
jgi:hypothetical protein